MLMVEFPKIKLKPLKNLLQKILSRQEIEFGFHVYQTNSVVLRDSAFSQIKIFFVISPLQILIWEGLI